jgi:hypothetical protein
VKFGGRGIRRCLAALLYALFCLWYTNLRGPLSGEETARFVAVLEERGSNPGQIDLLRRFMEQDSGRQFLMVNLLDMAADPGTVAGSAPGETSDQLLGRYMAHMYPELLKRACHPVFAGRAIADSVDLAGIQGAERWTRAALMRYRSRRDMLEIALNPDFGGAHHFKIAALEKTIAFPVESELYLSDPRLLLLLLGVTMMLLVDAVGGRSRRTSPS